MKETQGKNSKQEVEAEIAAEAVEKGGLTHCSPWLAQLACLQ